MFFVITPQHVLLRKKSPKNSKTPFVTGNVDFRVSVVAMSDLYSCMFPPKIMPVLLGLNQSWKGN